MLGNGIFNSMYNSAIVWSSDNSIYFDGVNDFVELVGQEGSFDAITGDISVSMWVRLQPVEDHSDTTLFQIYSRSNGKIKLWWDVSAQKLQLIRWGNDGSNTQYIAADLTTQTIRSGNHTHLGFRINGSGMQLFVNGSLQVGLTSTIQSWTTGVAMDIYFGSEKTDGGNVEFLNGWMHDITIWDTYLNQSSISEIYNEGEPSNVLELRHSKLKYYHNCSEKNFDSSQDPIPTVNLLSSSNPSLVGAIISRHDQIS
tara:strand:- start:517 stop:1281 length:765 start_codon:yes stop_codon:yes gene_type:complete